MKKILSVLIALMLVLSAAALAEGETYNIGICQLRAFVPSEGAKSFPPQANYSRRKHS